MKAQRQWSLVTALLLLVVPSRLVAQQPPGDTNLETVLQRLERVERELKELKLANGLPVEPKEQRVLVIASEARFQNLYDGTNDATRMLAVRVNVINLTDREVRLNAGNYELNSDDSVLKVQKLTPQLSRQRFFFESGTQPQSLSDFATESLTLEPAQAGQTWLLFSGLAAGRQVPQLKLKTTLPGDAGPQHVITVDLNQSFERQLQLTVERIGPRKSLGLITIGGKLNAISAGRVVSELDQLLADKVARVVIGWAQTAPAPDHAALHWLQQFASQPNGENSTHPFFPQLPSGFGEFHLIAPAAHRAQEDENSLDTQIRAALDSIGAPGSRVIHKNREDAVSAALHSAYQIVPRSELLEEIQHGHPLCRPAALAIGGSRLRSDDLPLVLELAADDQILIQRAALLALRHFGEPAAIDKLLLYARKNSEPLSSLSLDSLAGSRFGAAHEALLEFLKNEPPQSRRTIVASLARHPRPVWSQRLYEFVNDPHSGVRVEALAALTVIGHPQLPELLEACLRDEERAVQDAAFFHLAQREDRRSEQLALAWTLKHLEDAPPTAPMQSLLQRTKDQRAIKLLLRQVESPSSHRAQVIELLAQIADQDVAARLVTLYETLTDNERRPVLQTLARVPSPASREIAGRALQSQDHGIVGLACALLQTDASPAAIDLLIKAARQPGEDWRFVTVSGALAAIGTADARQVLREAVRSTHPNRQTAAINALRQLNQRSPAQRHLYTGQALEEQSELRRAAEQYDKAVALDPEHPEARLHRGNLALKRNELAKASEDFRQLLELDPLNSQGYTGLGIVLAREGKVDEAIKSVESVRTKFRNESMFLYNTACVYGRAVEHFKTQPDTPERNSRLEQYERQAIADLRGSIKLGLDEANQEWMKSDPDLSSLHDLPAFRQLTDGQAEEQ